MAAYALQAALRATVPGLGSRCFWLIGRRFAVSAPKGEGALRPLLNHVSTGLPLTCHTTGRLAVVEQVTSKAKAELSMTAVSESSAKQTPG